MECRAGELSDSAGVIFFEPGQLHLQPADLFVQLLLVGAVRPLPPLIGEQLFGALDQPLLPSRHLRRMHAKATRNLRRRATRERRQRHLRLHARATRHTLPCHLDRPPDRPPTLPTLAYQVVQFSGSTSRASTNAVPVAPLYSTCKPSTGEKNASTRSLRRQPSLCQPASGIRRTRKDYRQSLRTRKFNL